MSEKGWNDDEKDDRYGYASAEAAAAGAAPADVSPMLAEVLDENDPADVYYRRCVTILSERDLDPEFLRVAADFAYWAERYSDAFQAHLELKEQFERVEARAQIEEREAALDVGQKVTEKFVEARVKLNPQVVRARAELIGAEAAMVRMKQRVQAVERKKEAIQSIGANRREEMRGDPSIRRTLAREGEAYRATREGEG